MALCDNIDKDIENISMKALSYKTRTMVSQALNPEIESFIAEGLPKDWRGLAELMGFIYLEIKTYKRCDNPCENLLKDWEKKGERTIGQLWNYLIKLERYDIIEDEEFKSCLVRDAEKFHQHNTNSAVVMVESVSNTQTSTTDTYPESNTEQEVNEFEGVTVNEVNSNKPELFDAFVCYAPSDFSFVKLMLQTLEGCKYRLKLCVPARDLLPGSSENTVTAYLIAKRCKTVIIVLSPEFLNSPECDFQLKFAQALTPGSKTKLLIPILYKNCEIPAVLKYITLLNYSNVNQLEWFWKRLATSLLNASPLEEETQNKDKMESIKYDLPEARDSVDFQCSDETSAGSLSHHKDESGRQTCIPLASCSDSSATRSDAERANTSGTQTASTSGTGMVTSQLQTEDQTAETTNKKDTKKKKVPTATLR